MEKISILPADNAVYINGEMREVDCSSLDRSINAVQWCHCPDREKSHGEIEWVQDPFEDHKPNTKIDNLNTFSEVIDAWHKAPAETRKHARIRADKQVQRTEEIIAEIKKWPESIKDEVETKAKALRKMEAELVERRKQRDDVYADRLEKVKGSGDV